MTWEEFLNSGYNTEGWETADYYSEHHYTPTGGTENISYSYYPGNKKGISIREESLNCGSVGGYMWKKNYISIVSSSGFETIDKTIQKGYNYGLNYGNEC